MVQSAGIKGMWRLPASLLVRALGGLFLLEFVWLAIAPASRTTWLLENLLVFALGLALFLGARRFRLSPASCAQVLLFLSVHEIGAHYTYSNVPLDQFSAWLTGSDLSTALGWERNHFDRLVHLLYGLLLYYPVREFYLRVVLVRGAWGYVLPLGFILSTSLLYELLEWGVAVLLGGDVALDYVGAQGDVWDAHKDMALAGLGALVSLLITLLASRLE